MAHRVQEMLETYPRATQVDRGVLAAAIDALTACADICTACADACLAEEQVGELRRCIRLNLDCADLCRTTAALLLRQTEPDLAVVRAAVDACARACKSCGDECGGHAELHDHCRVCAEACTACEDACRRVLDAFEG